MCKNVYTFYPGARHQTPSKSPFWGRDELILNKVLPNGYAGAQSMLSTLNNLAMAHVGACSQVLHSVLEK
jgi:hypothetical protein